MIKILVALLLISSITSIAFSQPARKKYYGAAGFGFAFLNSDELNSIINQYNSNPLVTKKMGSMGMIFGPNILLGMNLDKEKHFFNFEFGFSLLFSATQTSNLSVTNGRVKTQDVQMKVPLINVGAQYFIKASDLIHLGAGIALNLGAMNFYFRSYDRLTPTPSYTIIQQNAIFSYAGFTPAVFVNFHFTKQFTLSFRSNYFLLLKSQNLTSLNVKLNTGIQVPGAGSATFGGPGVALNFLFKIGKH